jgi:hypothetical protein
MRLMRLLFTAAVLGGLAGPAVAADPAPARKIDFTTVLLDPDGKPFTECLRVDEADRTKCAERVDVTLGYLARAVLNLRQRGDESLPLDELVRRGQLASFVYRSTAAELDSGEVDLIKRLLAAVPSMQTTMVVAALKILDPVAVKDRAGR